VVADVTDRKPSARIELMQRSKMRKRPVA